MYSVYPDKNLLYNELLSVVNYITKYPLINQVFINNEEFSLVSNVLNINKLSNKLLNEYSYKISRYDAKKIKLLSSIEKSELESFKNQYFNPFIDSWNNIKKYATKYMCKPDMPIFNYNENTELNYFLVDDGELGGGMYLASAYSNFINWQNQFITLISSNINQDSILYCFSSQLKQEVYVQETLPENIIKFSDDIQKAFNDLLTIYSTRNIFIINDDKIFLNYNNYKRIKFDFKSIEEKLGALILPGVKQFKYKDDDEPINFMTYLYEGYRGKKSQVLVNYELKYPSKDLNNEEKKILKDFIKKNKNNREIMKSLLSSCQLLIDFIQKENFNEQTLLWDIIENLPSYIIINPKFKEFFEENTNDYIMDKKYFRVNGLLNIFNLIEHCCWKETKENINEQYKEKIEQNKKDEILKFFKNYNKNENNLITQKDLASALRKFISRYLSGKRGDTDINETQDLIGQIVRNDLWNAKIINDEEQFQTGIYSLTFGLKVSQAYDYYELLKGDSIDVLELNDEEESEDTTIKNLFKSTKMTITASFLPGLSSYESMINTIS